MWNPVRKKSSTRWIKVFSSPILSLLGSRLSDERHPRDIATSCNSATPAETWERSIQQTIALVRNTRPDDIGISFSYPYGTVFYDRVQEQIGAKKNWTHSDDLCVMFRATYKDESSTWR